MTAGECGFSVLVLTLDEERNLRRCLASVEWADDLVVLDSGSSDGTVEVARQAGARVFTRPFDTFAGQRNHAMDTVDFAHPWIFHLDADECFTEPLLRACEKVVAEDRHSAYFVPAKMLFMGRWLRWSSLYPSYQVRLVKRGEVRFRQVGHGQREEGAERGVGLITEPYLHYPLSKGLEDWLDKHNRYSSQEAAENLRLMTDGKRDLGGLVRFGDPVRRRRAVKALVAGAPLRPFLRFVYMYILRLGFLDGRPGLVYCRLTAMYERMIQVKMTEANGQRPLPGVEP